VSGPRVPTVALQPATSSDTSDTYDALVVGGGPGGAAAAYHLAAGGAKVLLVEKTTYPREKVCGDGLTPRGTAELDLMGLRDVYAGWPHNTGLRVHGTQGRTYELPWPEVTGLPSFGLTQTRHDLDQLLAEQAVKAGATLLEGTSVVRPLVQHGVVVGAELARDGEDGNSGNGKREDARRQSAGRENGTRKDGKPEPGENGQRGDTWDVRAQVVIAADGASSRVAQALGHERDHNRPLAVAIRQYFRTERDQDPWLDSYLELRAGDEMLPGYGWVFPLGDGRVNVGLGVLGTSRRFRDVNYRELLARWVTEISGEWGFDPGDPAGKPRSSPLPMGANRHPALHRGVLFVGDAAGMVNPFNGEGITYAMETGRLAAGITLEVLASGDRSALSRYADELTDRFGSYYLLGRTFAKVISDPRVMKLCVSYGLERPALLKLVLKLLSHSFEPRGGDATDRIVQALVTLAPAR
jgi:flavin-dependent dehydrogenase